MNATNNNLRDTVDSLEDPNAPGSEFEGDDVGGGGELADDLTLASMNLDELKAEAKKRNITLKSNEKADIIDEIISSSVSVPTDVKPGQVISLHSQTPEAKNLIQKARNIMVQNQEGGKVFTLFLKNRTGQFYQQTDIPGCRVRPETLKEVLKIVSPLPDGSQAELLRDLNTHPEKFEQPLLVRMKRRNGDGSFSNYVMLYVKEKQRVVEQQF